LGNKANLRGKFRVAPPGVKLLLAVVRRTVSALVGGEGESHDFINAIAEADDGAFGTFDNEVGSGGVGTVAAVGAIPDIEELGGAVGDVGQAAAEFAAPIEVVAGRGLDVRHDKTAEKGAGEESELKSLFHEHGVSYSNWEGDGKREMKNCEKLFGRILSSGGDGNRVLMVKLRK
jgi:hypothetical protein